MPKLNDPATTAASEAARKLPRQNTRLESEGAEFLVLGNLLMLGIPSYKAYTNMPSYDVVATKPETNRSARISVKSRWKTGASSFIIKNLDCDFAVIVKLNRGDREGRKPKSIRDPEYFVVPIHVIRDIPRTARWNKLNFASIPAFKSYKDRWDLIRDFLCARPLGKAKRDTPP